MAERFDSLFGWLDEQEAIAVLHSPTANLPNPGLQYVAATRLGAASSPESLNALLAASAWRGHGINERLTRRKALEALGRRPDPRSVARVVEALGSSDAGAVVCAANSLAKLRAAGQTMDPHQLTEALVGALHGPGTQQRAVIQCLTRLELHGARDAVERCINHADRLLDGAARACLVRQGSPGTLLQPVVSRLRDPEPGQRRTAVIDLDLAGQPEHLAAVVRTPVSMPLRALTAFSLARRALANGHAPAPVAALLDELCHDDPRRLQLIGQPEPTDNTPAGWIRLLLQRDENCQYGAAAGILQQSATSQLVILEQLHRHHGNDYGGHYMLMRLVGLGGHRQRQAWLKQGLETTAPQYRKSRIAAAVAMGELGLTDHRDALQALQDGAREEEQLRWAATMALALFQGHAHPSLALRAQALR